MTFGDHSASRSEFLERALLDSLSLEEVWVKIVTQGVARFGREQKVKGRFRIDFYFANRPCWGTLLGLRLVTENKTVKSCRVEFR